jgi:hypothetical protein
MEKKVIQFRKRSCGGGNGLGGDALVSLTTHGQTKTPVISITIRQPVMDKCRWRHGDRVVVDFERDATTAVFKLTRTEDVQDGYRLSCSKGQKYGAVIKMTVDEQAVPAVFPDAAKRSLVGTLLRGDANGAAIGVDYSE